MAVRGIRGATVSTEDRPEAVSAATRELLLAMMEANQTLQATDIASAFFTVTEDIRSFHPAKAARELGWDQVPMLCTREIPVPGSLPLCIRVLLHWNTELPQRAVRHVYLGKAASMRPDLGPVDTQALTNGAR